MERNGTGGIQLGTGRAQENGTAIESRGGAGRKHTCVTVYGGGEGDSYLTSSRGKGVHELLENGQ